MQYDNLNKENFFNEMMEKSPKAMEKFCAYIDNYKINMEWSALFHDGAMINVHEEFAEAPKFHEIPFEMQNGIICTFFNGFGKGVHFLLACNFVSDIAKFKLYLQNDLYLLERILEKQK